MQSTSHLFLCPLSLHRDGVVCPVVCLCGLPVVAFFLQMFLSLLFPPLASASTHLPPVASDLSPKATPHPPFYCFPLSTSFLSLPRPLPFLHFSL
uniref:Uncharacterized protein n=1 Tax=Takifugu rubripes TaxID=31033 RepID=A0A674NDY2_TAKRU